MINFLDSIMRGLTLKGGHARDSKRDFFVAVDAFASFNILPDLFASSVSVLKDDDIFEIQRVKKIMKKAISIKNSNNNNNNKVFNFIKSILCYHIFMLIIIC